MNWRFNFRLPLSVSKGFQNLFPFFVLMLLSLSVAACNADSESNAIGNLDFPPDSVLTETSQVGHLAPDFLLQTLDGREIHLSDYRGHVVFLNFWATWCGPCKIEMPAIEKLYREFRPKGLAVVAVSSDSEGAAVTRPYRDSLGLSFTIAHDPEMLVGRLYGVHSLPLTFLVNREGVITHQIFGARDWDDTEARSGIRQLLQSR
ncbi:MAG: TlpA family protein disulfide reductase [Nitrospirae bacterium]|nr:MAG: TlpA family protein disulfide reductase [Nitrospirota bacterium]